MPLVTVRPQEPADEEKGGQEDGGHELDDKAKIEGTRLDSKPVWRGDGVLGQKRGPVDYRPKSGDPVENGQDRAELPEELMGPNKQRRELEKQRRQEKESMAEDLPEHDGHLFIGGPQEPGHFKIPRRNTEEDPGEGRTRGILLLSGIDEKPDQKTSDRRNGQQ